jgi:acetate kinase
MNRKDQNYIASLYMENINQPREIVDKVGEPIAVGDEVAIPVKSGIEIVKVVAIDPNKQLIKVGGIETGKQIVVSAQNVVAFDTGIDYHAQEQHAIKALRDATTRYRL